ncbi:MAG TPA: SGNH/GDSL hydrolase family protein [Thermoanaerobaculia bacterium]|nr:SGNH/GDSL hydrolase family protein [Thermoanaerobaculia bacterium]
MLKKLGLSLAALVLALLAAELLVRALGAAPQIYVIRKGRFQLSRNPKIGYEPVPLAYKGHDLSFYDYQGSSNSQGFRDVEHAVAKPAGVYRVVVLGDSIGAGLKVERYEDTFPAILGQLLNARGLRAEVINLSVSGYNTQQEVETLIDRGLRYQPDLVIVAYALSDRGRLDGDIMKTLLEEEGTRQGVSGARVHPWLVKSALYRFLRFRVAAARKPQVVDQRRYLDLVSNDTVAQYLGVLAGLSRQRHFDVLVAVFPRFVKNFHAYRFGRQHAYVRDLAQQDGLRFLDLLEPFARCRETSETPISADNFHPTAYGHRCAAQAMADEILGQRRSP